MKRARWLPLIALALMVALGGYLRLARLGAAEFDQDDDLDLYFAARSVQAGHGPLLPSGMRYARGQDVTQMIAVSNRYVRDQDVAARLPSALFGVLGLVLFGAIAWALAGPWAAVLADALLAINPELVFQSRSARFYTYQAVFGLVALFAGWQVVRWMGRREAPSSDVVRRQWGWAVVTIAAFALAARVQVTTLTVLAGWGAVIALAAGLDLRARGWRAWRQSVPLQLTVAGLVLLVIGAVSVGILGAPSAVRDIWDLVHYVPTWAGGTPGSPLAYYYGLSDQYPVLLSLAPAIFLVLLLSRARLAAFLFLWFAVPLALHSFVLAWKADRYVLLAMPALFLAAGAVAADGLSALARALRRSLLRAQFPSGTSTTLAGLAVTASALFLIATTPAFGRARKSMDTKIPGYTPGWRASGQVLRSMPGIDTIPLGSTNPLASLKYWGRVNFTVQRGLADNAIRTGNGPTPPSGAQRDFYVGVPILLTPASIRAQFPHKTAVLIGFDNLAVTYDNVDSQLVRDVRQRGEELCRGRCGGMHLYLYPLTLSLPSPASAPSRGTGATTARAPVARGARSESAPDPAGGPEYGEAR